MLGLTQQQRNEASEGVTQSAIGAAPLTLPATLTKPTREIYIGSGGSLILTFLDGSRVEHVGLITGLSYPWAVTKVEAGTTGTSAASVIAHF